MKYSEQRELVTGLRELADFYERPKSVELECPSVVISTYPAVYGSITTIDEQGNKTTDYGVKPLESLEKVKRIAKVIGSCQKDYTSSYFKLVKKFGKHITLQWNVTREAVCRKVPTGETRVIEAYSQPERTEQVYEYVCEDVSLLS